MTSCLFVNYYFRLLSVPEGNAVLITGCSSGFGYRLATRLANQGTLVFAGVRKEEDGDNLKKGTLHPDNIHTLILDVTKEEVCSFNSFF